MSSSPMPPVIVPPERDTAGMSGLATALKRATVSQCHPRMLMAILLPFFIIFIGAVLLLWFFWTPLSAWLTQQAETWTMVNTVDGWLVAVGLFSLKIWLVPMLAAAILLPVSGIIGVAVAAVFVMPIVLRHIGERDYPDLQRLGSSVSIISIWNAVWVMTVFALGWLFTLPLWLLPPLGIALSFFWWTFAFSRLMRIDAIVEHATAAERRALLSRHNGGFWALGLICALLNLLPPAWIILPVYASLLFAHYGLQALQDARRYAVPR